jgi:hypothetical protein
MHKEKSRPTSSNKILSDFQVIFRLRLSEHRGRLPGIFMGFPEILLRPAVPLYVWVIFKQN